MLITHHGNKIVMWMKNWILIVTDSRAKEISIFWLEGAITGKAMFCKLKGLSTHLHSVTFDSTLISLSGTLSASVVLGLGLSCMSRRHPNTDFMAFIQYSCWDISPLTQIVRLSNWFKKLVQENLHHWSVLNSTAVVYLSKSAMKTVSERIFMSKISGCKNVLNE